MTIDEKIKKKAELFGASWNYELMKRDIESKEQELERVKNAQKACAEEIEKLTKELEEND